ncbi:aerobic-type carbon monoxide dehydrogenase, middle subunit CoxM/CutM-like protein [Desulfosporosinus acidiphilus SJ4]|uniref:Aerobic-type carbon monoxide dehydrogenase, middle subunit CoxM/CutM-like protein n=1 Tax=Desulfosporosinus acidiphilus (strain DSM 22704 / JCM 16185 / SJ4) TaxID=646529 RepID=I4D5E2_DESAJ|nr:xanthine dehydrogenase FAD-binding subunit XdhB [Desulfosporosinus acidiphilus]AFM41016.1 aerobic-type carbon monoxide dehydrogenase, middle subunit CoxM/CutM-like protein [Desulfosporosinus acidiphilus SJ4]
MYDILGYYEAETLREALELLAAKPKLKIIAGGTDVLVKMHGGQLEEAELLSIRKIPELTDIRKLDNGTIAIGPMATFTQVFNDRIIREHVPILTEAAISMGGPQIRNVATIGGNVCNGATSADSASSLFALNARLRLQNLEGERVIPVQEFYLGPGKVDLKPGEVLTAILINPEDYQGFGGQYIKFAMREAMDIATLGVAVLCRPESGSFREIRIGLGVAGPTPLRCSDAEEYARGKKITQETIREIGKLALNSTKARTSWRASKEYREHLVEELVQRALQTAIANAGGVELV